MHFIVVLSAKYSYQRCKVVVTSHHIAIHILSDGLSSKLALLHQEMYIIVFLLACASLKPAVKNDVSASWIEPRVVHVKYLKTIMQPISCCSIYRTENITALCKRRKVIPNSVLPRDILLHSVGCNQEYNPSL